MKTLDIDPLKQAGLDRCEKLVAILTSKGLKAYFGQEWDGANDHDDPEFWYFHARDNGGVGAYVEYDEGTYDQGFLEPAHADSAIPRLNELENEAARAAVWNALLGSKTKGKKT